MRFIFCLFLCFALFSSYFCGQSFSSRRRRRGSQVLLLKSTDEPVSPKLEPDERALKEIRSLETSAINFSWNLVDCDFDFVGLLRKVEYEVYEKQRKEHIIHTKLSFTSSEMENFSFYTLSEPDQQRNAENDKVWACGDLKFTRDKFLVLLRKIVLERESQIQQGRSWEMHVIYRFIVSKFQLNSFFAHISEQMSLSSPENLVPSVVVYSTPEQMLMSCTDKEICFYQDVFTKKKDADIAHRFTKYLLKHKGYQIAGLRERGLSKFAEEYMKFTRFSTQELIGHSSRCSEAIAKTLKTFPANTLKMELNSKCKEFFEAFTKSVEEYKRLSTKPEFKEFVKLFKLNMLLSPILQGVLMNLEKTFYLNPEELVYDGIYYPYQFSHIIQLLKRFDPKGKDFLNDDGYPVLKLS